MNNFIDRENEYYPKLLKEISDPPGKLYYDGDVSLLKKTGVSVVGSRKASKYGEIVAKQIGKRLAESGITVVSGLAMGIDTAAHFGALDSCGKTIAVLGCGIDRYYPAQNRRLMDRIKAEGLVISEYPDGTSPRSYHFPQRNRIISGLCESTVVVEAGRKSGSLITAELAASQGRNVYAVPGNITSMSSFGANMLIRDGAVPLFIIDDLIRDLGLEPQREKRDILKLGEDEERVLKAVMKSSEVTVDDICRETMMSPEKINGILTILEIKGLVDSSLGKVFAI